MENGPPFSYVMNQELWKKAEMTGGFLFRFFYFNETSPETRQGGLSDAIVYNL